MDLFTKKANNIIKKLDENKTEHIVYSSEEEELPGEEEIPEEERMPEEDAETYNKIPGIDKSTMSAINLAQKMSTQAQKSGVPGFRTDPQVAMNKAYGKLMVDLAAKLSKIKI